MNITFLGATHEVTGSCTLIQVCGHNVLVDYGMEQGANIFENQPLPVNPAEIDCVFLTHAHIDHSGNLPLLYKNGFRGKIYATEPTCNLCNIMLRDSAHIQEFEAEWRNRKAKRSGEGEYLPVYTVRDAEGAIGRLRPCAYGQRLPVLEGVEVRFSDVGHLLGSAAVELWLTECGVCKKIVFSGDVGNLNQPILQDPKPIAEADYVVLESTYGDRLHPPRPDYLAELTDCIQTAFDRGGNVIIPSFAVGRTQEMLYFLRQIKDEGRVQGHPDFSVYVDSPLANEATSIFLQCNPAYLEDKTRALIDQGVNPLVFPGLKISVSSDESKAINFDPAPKVILSASGMCDAGRIRHHLKHNLWRKECIVLFVGYQAVGTLGRALYDGAKKVKLFGEEIAVHAEIRTLAGVSGHADRDGLIAWLHGFSPQPARVFINHGEDAVCTGFAAQLAQEFGYNTFAPYSGTCFDLATGALLTQTEGVRLQPQQKAARAATVFNRLVAAASRLLGVARKCEGMPNKDLAKFESQITQLCDKWER